MLGIPLNHLKSPLCSAKRAFGLFALFSLFLVRCSPPKEIQIEGLSPENFKKEGGITEFGVLKEGRSQDGIYPGAEKFGGLGDRFIPEQKSSDSLERRREEPLPSGKCRSDQDCEFYQACDPKTGLCFTDCTKGGNCFAGDLCDSQRRRCLCSPRECSKLGGICHPERELCISSCRSDGDCPDGYRCTSGKCRSNAPNDGGPERDMPPPLGEGEDCSSPGTRCSPGLLCVKTLEGPSLCLRPCRTDADCKASGQGCAPELLSNGLGLCGKIVGEGESCSTAKRLLCGPGFRCKSGKCQRRQKVGVFDQCDPEHICTPSSLVCVSFGSFYGSLCLKTCLPGRSGSCSKGQKCVVPPGAPKGVCLIDCKKQGERCSHPYLRCQQISGGQLACVPRGKGVPAVLGDPCGGPYGKCESGLECRILFARSGIGFCTKKCSGGGCPNGFSCAVLSGGKYCVRTCRGYGAQCPPGLQCTPLEKRWVCAP